MCEEDVTAKIVVQDRNNKLVSITEWVNDLYQFYRTSQALTPYYAKHNNKAKFYKLGDPAQANPSPMSLQHSLRCNDFYNTFLALRARMVAE